MVHRLDFRAMGSEMTVIVAAGPGSPSPDLQQVRGWFEEWEQCLSRFRLDSELSLLNRSADQPVPVSDTLWKVYQLALKAELVTGGLIRPTIGSALIQAGYDRSFGLLPVEQDAEFAALIRPVEASSVVLADERNRNLCLPPGIQLDLGGVAKGWAAHQAMERLQHLGPALMNAGGDIAISDALPGGLPWEVGVADPFHPDKELLLLHLGRCGVATSGKDRRRWIQNGHMRHHIIDPRSGLPADSDILTATVVASTVMEAEAAAKTALILGSEAGIAWLDEAATLAGLLILEDGQLVANAKMQDYL